MKRPGGAAVLVLRLSEAVQGLEEVLAALGQVVVLLSLQLGELLS